MKKVIIINFILLAAITGYSQETILYPSDALENGMFGANVASYNNLLAVCAWGGNSNVSLGSAVYIFRYDGVNWNQEAKLIPSDASMEGQFGLGGISIYENYILIGENGNNSNGSNSGAAYVFKYNGTTWIEEAKLTPSDADEEDSFGWSVAIRGDYALIGASYKPVNGLTLSGVAYLFRKEGMEWIEEAKLIPSDPTQNAIFGNDVALGENYAYIGAPRAYYGTIKTGVVYPFKKEGQEWVEQEKIYPSDLIENQGFGYQISVEENKMAIGVYNGIENGDYERGAAYIFNFDGTNWIEEAKLIPSDLVEEDMPAYDIAVHDTKVLISLRGEHNTGTLYLFEKEGSEWEQKLKINSSNAVDYDQYGRRVSLSEEFIFTGAFGNSTEGTGVGATYIYDLTIALNAESFPEEKAKKIVLFPNPVREELFVDIAVPDIIIDRCEVYNINGALLHNIEYKSASYQNSLDVSNLQPGVYIVKLYSERQLFRGKFVKME